MKNIFSTCILAGMAFMVSCSLSCSRQPNRKEIDMTDKLDVFAETNLNDIASDITYIPLHGDSNLILSGNSVIKHIDSDNIIIESERQLYRFDHNGSFLNLIGSIGQGPEEYTAPGRVSYDEATNKLYLFTNNILQQWSMDGKHFGNIEFPDKASLQSAVALTNDTILIIRRNYHDNGQLTQCLQWTNPEGILMKSVDFACDSTLVNIVMRAYPELYKVNNEVFVRNEWDNQIYRINFENIQLEKTLDFGKSNSNRWLFQDATQREKIGNEIVKIESSIFSDNTIWLEFWLDNALHYMLIDRDGTLLHHSLSKNYIDNPIGLAIDGSKAINFWSSYVANTGKLYSIIQPEDFDQEQLQELSRLTATTLTSDSNPIIIQVSL
ncbi:MAG: 6-bladed beta-propeller [Muribaculaceae bacterium]|nr:6-bladed beta-propeller [Muribaculaceae bacterium]